MCEVMCRPIIIDCPHRGKIIATHDNHRLNVKLPTYGLYLSASAGANPENPCSMSAVIPLKDPLTVDGSAPLKTLSNWRYMYIINVRSRPNSLRLKGRSHIRCAALRCAELVETFFCFYYLD